MRTFLLVAAAGVALATSHALTNDTAASPPRPEPVAVAPVPPPANPTGLVAHEWGTFTSFSGSSGVPVGFSPNNEDLPYFVYHQVNPFSKGVRLARGGLVSMETPVVYFYTDKDTRASVTVDFPKGWITEWYPFASAVPVNSPKNDRTGGQSIRWDVKLTPSDKPKFPRTPPDAKGQDNPYYHARETDAVPVQAEITGNRSAERYDEHALQGGTVFQREKFLFYRGVGTFAPPVVVQALGGDKVRVVNNSGGTAAGAVVVTARAGKVGFRPLGELATGASTEAALPEPSAKADDLAAFLVKELTAAGLYEKEAKAMVATWSDAWFYEDGSRVLYLVPRAKTDELLPITISPKPVELVRVLVGRHDFLTPEQEATAEKQLKRLRAAEAELNAANTELNKLGRFRAQAQDIANAKLTAAREAAAPHK
ncbi:hypothetical protein R5W23_000596 [Gemmata sp. JC673]|uniref:Uncharacterized protein n=1 Tax=Gemmata algarum TaxID=2975278 RepID=A0ABU5EYB2_9BACT|nr:hypothetical protein [Gemmata algarum]MDY3559602.1 hypothetical protein [Gemmata algarum]